MRYEVWGCYWNDGKLSYLEEGNWSVGTFCSFAKAREAMAEMCRDGLALGRKIGSIFVERAGEVREYVPFVSRFEDLPIVTFNEEIGWPEDGSDESWLIGTVAVCKRGYTLGWQHREERARRDAELAARVARLEAEKNAPFVIDAPGFFAA